MTDVKLKLQSPKDVDVELWDKKTGEAVIAFNVGKKCNKLRSICNASNKRSKKYGSTMITYSGYNGMKNANGIRKYGWEYIHLKGKTDRPFIMKVFGYRPGVALVTYSWGADVKKCASEKKSKESKAKARHKEKINKFQAAVAAKKAALVKKWKEVLAKRNKEQSKCASIKNEATFCKFQAKKFQVLLKRSVKSLTRQNAICKRSTKLRLTTRHKIAHPTYNSGYTSGRRL